jgi:hypothetical protein
MSPGRRCAPTEWPPCIGMGGRLGVGMSGPLRRNPHPNGETPFPKWGTPLPQIGRASPRMGQAPPPMGRVSPRRPEPLRLVPRPLQRVDAPLRLLSARQKLLRATVESCSAGLENVFTALGRLLRRSGRLPPPLPGFPQSPGAISAPSGAPDGAHGGTQDRSRYRRGGFRRRVRPLRSVPASAAAQSAILRAWFRE